MSRPTSLDVVNEMKWQELKNVVLVGHSYGGMVISGVAEKMETAIGSFVMLDAFMPQDGQSVVDMQTPAMRDTGASRGTVGRDDACRRAPPSCSRSMSRTAPGSMHNVRRSQSNASCRGLR